MNEKFVNALNETKLYHNELSRAQEINRELMTEKSKIRSIVSQSLSRSNNEMQSTYKTAAREDKQDSLTYDSVMSSTTRQEDG